MERKTKILFSVPNTGRITGRTCLAIARLCQRPDICYMAVEGGPVDQVRNRLMRRLLIDHECTHLLMLDSDVDPPDDIVDLLLACDAPIASAIVPILTQNAIVSNIGGKGTFITDWSGITEPFDATVCGAGCVLIRREVAETVPWPWFRDCEDKLQSGRISEDVYFCKKAAKHGFDIKAHPAALCGHFKTVNLLEIVQAFNSLRRVYEAKIAETAQQEGALA